MIITTFITIATTVKNRNLLSLFSLKNAILFLTNLIFRKRQ
jgi:hypothetical protein